MGETAYGTWSPHQILLKKKLLGGGEGRALPTSGPRLTLREVGTPVTPVEETGAQEVAKADRNQLVVGGSQASAGGPGGVSEPGSWRKVAVQGLDCCRLSFW